jgi:hypothetical protein
MVPMSGERTCPSCGASMQEGQDWCLRCGTAASRSARTAPGWRSAALALGATAALALGAAAAAYAALEQHPARRPPAPVAQTPPVTSSTVPPTGSSPSTIPGTGTIPETVPPAGTRLPSLPRGPRTLNTPSGIPQIPSSTPTPRGDKQGGAANGREGGAKGSGGTNSRGNGRSRGNGGASHHQGGEPEEGAGGQSGPEGEAGGEGEKRHKQALPILLDTNAAEVYNPESLPPTRFGDPSLAIDGEATTAWGVELEPAQAPAVEVGLALNLNATLKVVKLSLVTETPGMTVQVYGTSDRTLPASLSSTSWVRLSHAHLVKRRRATIELQEATKRFRRLLIWIVKAPTSSNGQLTGGEVKINEVQLYEPR